MNANHAVFYTAAYLAGLGHSTGLLCLSFSRLDFRPEHKVLEA